MTALAAGAPLMGCGTMDQTDEEPVAASESPLTATQRTNLINAKYNANVSLLGSPISGTLQQFSNGAKEDFTGAGNNSSIYVGDSVNAAHIVLGLIRGDYLSQGAQSGVLGYPTTDEGSTAFGTGRYNLFQFGRSLWRSGASAAYSTHGNIDGYYQSVGMEWGYLGYPISDEYAFGSGRKNDFEYGKIYYNGSSRAVLTGANPRNQLIAQNAPRITGLSMPYYGQDAASCINIQGAGFPPGAYVLFQANDPGAPGVHPSSSGTTVQSDGTFSFDESMTGLNAECTAQIHTVGGLATIEAFVIGGPRAIRAASFPNGIPYTGSL